MRSGTSSLSHTLNERDNFLRYFRLSMAVSFAVLTLLAVVTAWRFDDLYAAQISVYPTLSAVLSLENLFVVFVVLLTNIGVYSKLKQARQEVARTAYLLVTGSQTVIELPVYTPLKQDFLKAADLPVTFSIDSLRKMSIRHFNSFDRKITRTVSARRDAWIRLDNQRAQAD
tara:strand:- start:46 stop:558 length:513 start_codon:yes stop_codon:yes gene_type:complete